ncbi:hypothetical protein GQ600_3342 [Phytophthora cactorum]|nr:hypothetical protein GQ600_3342 [Phytophthora cactorum]
MRPSARKRPLPPLPPTATVTTPWTNNSVSDGSEFALARRRARQSNSDKSSRSGDLLRQHSRLPPACTEFNSWDAIDSYIRGTRGKHASLTFKITAQMLKLRTNKKVGERNAIIQRTGSESTPISEAWVWYARTLVSLTPGNSSHVGRQENTPRLSAIECPAQQYPANRIAVGETVLHTVEFYKRLAQARKAFYSILLRSLTATPPFETYQSCASTQDQIDRIDYKCAAPVRPHGRPKQKASSKKAKKNREITGVRHDSNMHHMQLDLSILSGLLHEDHSFESRRRPCDNTGCLNSRKKQNKQPIAHRKVKLPSNKVIIREDEISRILPKEMLRKCSKKVTNLQSKHKGLKEGI